MRGVGDARGFVGGWRAVGALFGILALVAIGFGLQVALKQEEIPSVIPPERADLGGRTIEVLFPAQDGGWLRERREILASNPKEVMIRRVLEELLRGPSRSGQGLAVFPASTKLQDVFWDREEELTLSFSEHLRSDHPGGSQAELATVESLLGTLKLAFPEISRVRILVDGDVVASIAGHVDLTRPLETFVPR